MSSNSTVAARLLVSLSARVPDMLDGADQMVFDDLDDTIGEVHGYDEQAAAFGYSGVLGLNAQRAGAPTRSRRRSSSAPAFAAATPHRTPASDCSLGGHRLRQHRRVVQCRSWRGRTRPTSATASNRLRRWMICCRRSIETRRPLFGFELRSLPALLENSSPCLQAIRRRGPQVVPSQGGCAVGGRLRRLHD